MIYVILTVAIIIGGLMFADIRPVDILEKEITDEQRDAEAKQAKIGKQSKKSLYKRHKDEIMQLIQLNDSKTTWSGYITTASIAGVAGIVIAAIMGNPVLIFVLFGIGISVPSRLLIMRSQKRQKRTIALMETAMGLVTNSYVQTGDLSAAITNNLAALENPVKEIMEIIQSEIYLGVRPVQALINARSKINNQHWRQWIDRLIQCQNDSTKRELLHTILADLADVRKTQAGLDTIMESRRKNFRSAALVAIAAIPGTKLLSQSWYEILMTHPIGQLAVAVSLTLLAIAANKAIQYSSPLGIDKKK